MHRASFLLLPLVLAGCTQPPSGNATTNGVELVANLVEATNRNAAIANGSSDGGAPDPVLRRETVSGTFTGWEMGDYLWAKIAVPGRAEISAQPGPSPIDLFLDANRGRPVTVEIATVRASVPEAGGAIEIQRIVAARSPAGTADAWWAALPPAARQTAQRRFEDGALSGGR
jgi:hypothetical protein